MSKDNAQITDNEGTQWELVEFFDHDTQQRLMGLQFSPIQQGRILSGVVENSPFDFVEPCEPECTPVRHAYHQGQWDMAIRMAKGTKFEL